jgi:hypothetical protein
VYPTIELRWKEVGLSFQVQFVKRNFIPTEIGGVEINVGINERLVGLLHQNNRLSAEELANDLGISPDIGN